MNEDPRHNHSTIKLKTKKKYIKIIINIILYNKKLIIKIIKQNIYIFETLRLQSLVLCALKVTAL